MGAGGMLGRHRVKTPLPQESEQRVEMFSAQTPEEDARQRPGMRGKLSKHGKWDREGRG